MDIKYLLIDYFTVSPKTLAQCRAQVKLNTHSKNRVCPKCGITNMSDEDINKEALNKN